MMLANIIEAVFVFSPIGTLVYLIMLHGRNLPGPTAWPSILVPCAVCGTIGLTVETIQLWCIGRTPDIEDVIYAVIGGYAGASAVQIYQVYSSVGKHEDG